MNPSQQGSDGGSPALSTISAREARTGRRGAIQLIFAFCLWFVYSPYLTKQCSSQTWFVRARSSFSHTTMA